MWLTIKMWAIDLYVLFMPVKFQKGNKWGVSSFGSVKWYIN